MSNQRTKKMKRKAVLRGRKNNNYHTKYYGCDSRIRFWK